VDSLLGKAGAAGTSPGREVVGTSAAQESTAVRTAEAFHAVAPEAMAERMEDSGRARSPWLRQH